MPTLSIKNLEKHFSGLKAVDDLSLSFESGKVTSLVGPNGSGKSTLINTITGMHKMDSGFVYIGEKTKVSKMKRYDIAGFGMTRTFQDVHLFEQMTVLDNILIVLTERHFLGSLFEKHKKFHLEIAEDILTKVGLWDKRDQMAEKLSYGQRKLLEIARVLAMEKSPTGEVEIVFLDEPFAGLFPEMVKIVVSVIKELREKGKTIILVEHNMDLIRELSDYLYVLDAGKLLAEGDPDQVLARKDVMEAYLGE